MEISNTIDTFIHSELKKENNKLIIKNQIQFMINGDYIK